MFFGQGGLFLKLPRRAEHALIIGQSKSHLPQEHLGAGEFTVLRNGRITDLRARFNFPVNFLSVLPKTVNDHAQFQSRPRWQQETS